MFLRMKKMFRAQKNEILHRIRTIERPIENPRPPTKILEKITNPKNSKNLAKFESDPDLAYLVLYTCQVRKHSNFAK